MKRRVCILGSTGSVGRQALEVIREFPCSFTAEVLSARDNATLLIEQALYHQPDTVVIACKDHYKKVRDALEPKGIKVYAGQESLEQVVELENVDLVLNALVGYAALKPTLHAIEHGKVIAMANKETFAIAGELVTTRAREKKAHILPVDSEHSAIFQCLSGEENNRVEKIYLTASGGPFRAFSPEQLQRVTPQDALNHPNWDMGNKITIDSASFMNKGLEVIEARWLFNLSPTQIDVIVHPQSIVHSLVQFEDGSLKAQMGLPSMKLPVQYALSYPKRLKNNHKRFNFLDYPTLTFEAPRTHLFKNLSLARYALEKEGNMPCILNAANEVAVEAFLNHKIAFPRMSDLIEKAMHQVPFIAHPSYDNLVDTHRETRELVTDRIKNHSIKQNI